VPGSDLLDATRHERAFGAWLSAAKKFVRANEFLGYFLELMPIAAGPSPRYEPTHYFRDLLEGWYRDSNDSIRLDIGQEVLNHISLDPARRG
jgi:hypothetical protein